MSERTQPAIPDPLLDELPEIASTMVQQGSVPLHTTPRPAWRFSAGNGQRIGQYETQKRLGEGGMGIVFQGWDTQLQRKVAIKVLLPQYASDREACDRFLREARSAAAITHDNVVSIYHVGDHNGAAYLVMPLLKGYSLENYLLRKGLPTGSQTIRIIREIAAGLSAAHARSFIHRDIKPANIWLEAPNGRVKILDFGIAKPMGATEWTAISEAGVIMGTPAFMSPEQARGATIDSRSDLFSLGALAYRMSAGVAPFARPTPMDTITALVTEDATPLCELNPQVPPRFAALIHRLIGRNPDDRPATCEEVIRELRHIERDNAGDRMATTAILTAQTDIRISSDAIPNLEAEVADPGYEVIDDYETTEVIPRSMEKPKQKTANASHRKSILAFAVGASLAAGSVYWLISGTTKTDTPVTPVTPTLPTPTAASQPKDDNERRPPRDDSDHRPGDPWLDAEGRPRPPPPPCPRPPLPKHPPGKDRPPPPPRP